MSDVAQSKAKVQLEGLTTRSPVSEAMLQSMAGAINYSLANILPVGSLIPSELTEAVFQQETGTNWVLSDGRDVTGSRFHELTGRPNIADLRGTVPRGKDNGRNLNPDGDLALGAYQADQFKAHNHGGGAHTHSFPIGDGDSGARDKAADGDQFTKNVSTASSGTIIQTQGGNETRAKSTTVNFFVRIN